MNKEFTASLKSVETENVLDLYFYRPIGFQIARVLKHTPVTPNMVTILSIFVGAGTGIMFYYNDLTYNIIGILLLIAANIMDCVDGQLARITGVKSKIGRVLDGISGDIWFIVIYVCLALRLTHTYGSAWFFVPAVLSGISHLIQAEITDYYKTLHLFFESKEKGIEFQTSTQIIEQRLNMKNGINRLFYSLYLIYTRIQERLTPALQLLLNSLQKKYGEDIPESIRLEYRKKSSRLMKSCIDFLTFNGRTIVLFVVIISGYVWIYFIYEIIILNFVLFLAIYKHEKMCKKICIDLD
ncbi:MAG: CDP-alcohol phosphatidyltransferase family protein [Tannerella sp.]|jgi:hypothetical protein|nr:CDP-alcohol phosphatidyltransferase family protein [Tannerella sp.]